MHDNNTLTSLTKETYTIINIIHNVAMMSDSYTEFIENMKTARIENVILDTDILFALFKSSKWIETLTANNNKLKSDLRSCRHEHNLFKQSVDMSMQRRR